MFTEVITARKMAELALRSSEAMNRAAMDKAPIGKAVVLPDGHFMKVNPALCHLLGYSEQELLAKDFQSITYAEDRVTSTASMRALLDGRSPSYQLEKRYVHRDGRVIWAQLNMSLVRRPSGEAEFVVAQIQDISERKAIERINDELASVVSHELRAPLTSIRDALRGIAALRDMQMPDPARQLFDVCQVNASACGAGRRNRGSRKAGGR
jgi:PAS domain S-box-containing protein